MTRAKTKPTLTATAGGGAGSRARVRGRGRIGIAILAICAAVAAAGFWWYQRLTPFTVTPTADQNILLITIDTLRADALSSYGGHAATPNLDRLAAHGARFTFAHSHAVVTLPSHTSILTGRYPFDHGIRDNGGYRMNPGTATIATKLKAAGFSTAAFVGGFPLTKRFGLTPGFDLYDDQIGELKGPVDFSLPERRADQVVGRALDWISKQNGKFFSWVHVFDPHSPYNPPAPFSTQYTATPYDGEVAWTDYALGPLLDRLATLSRRTLVIVTSDHGESLGEHGEETHGLFAYEGTLHVPLIISIVGGAATTMPAGEVIDSPARHIDILPTILDAIGAVSSSRSSQASALSALPGSSLLPVINSGDRADRPQYFESMSNMLARGWAPLRGVISGRDKFIDVPVPELYALPSDPAELRNIASSNTDRATVLTNVLGTYHAQLPGQPRVEASGTNEQLRALGYAAGTNSSLKKTFTEADDPKRLVDLDRLLHEAGDLYEHGKIPESLEKFEAIIARRPDMGDAYRYESFVYWQTGHPDKGIATIERALKNGVTDRDIRVRLAHYLTERGDAARAITILEPLGNDDVEAMNALGIAYGRMNRTSEASATFRRVLQLDPTNGLAYQNLGTADLERRNVGGAEENLRKAIELDPTLAGAYTALGVVLSKTNRRADAIDAWKQAVRLDAADFDALYNLTVTLADAGRRDEARQFARQFLSTAPPSAFAQERAELAAIAR